MLKRLSFFPLLFITMFLHSQNTENTQRGDTLTIGSRQDDGDTTKRRRPTGIVTRQDTASVERIDTFHLPLSTDSLEAPVFYSASDSGVLDIPGKIFILYGKASTKYKTIDLAAATIELDNETGIAKAYYSVDSTGGVLDRPKLIDGEMESEMDSLFYNFRTQRGITKSTYTKQGEMFVFAERIKKIDAQSYFAANGRFTTCNLDTPHFAFRAPKMKLVNNKWAYSGIAYPEFEGVPMPIGIPFGIFPLSQGRHSGLIAPSFNTTESYGIGMTGLGYYKALNDYFDAMLTTDIYSYGGWAVHFAPNYRKRYRYNGGLRFDFNKTRLNFKGDPDYVNSNTFNFSWNHNMDAKARPGTNFSANVTFGSPGYNRNQVYNPMLNFVNKINSTINYSQTWKQGKYNMNVSANHNQDNQTGLYTISLPNLNFTATTLYPLRPREPKGTAKWYEKFGVGYQGQFQNRFNFYQSKELGKQTSFKEIIDTAQWGAEHRIPISLPLPALGPFNITPGVSFTERWYGQQVLRTWNEGLKKVDTSISKGFYAAREMTFNMGMQTAVFGTFNFGKNLRVRHVIRPNVSANYKPDFQKKFYYRTQVDTTGRQLPFSVFEGTMYQAFSPGEFGGLSFGLQNNIEAKRRNREDTTGDNAWKKVRILDNMGISSAYNFMADSFRLAPFSITMGTTLFEKLSVNGSTSIDPYMRDSLDRRIDRYAWNGDKFSLGRINSGGINMSISLQSKKGKKEEQEKEYNQESGMYLTPDEEMMQREYVRNNPGEYADFSIPWSLNIGFGMHFNRRQKADYSGFVTEVYSNINLQGEFNISPKWKMGSNLYYDLKTREIGQMTMFLSRELHCWQMSINVVPIGFRRSFNISISPRSSILRDLKVNRTRVFYN